MQIIFMSGTKCLWLTQYVNKSLDWHKKLGQAQNIFGPVKGQGINESTPVSKSLSNVSIKWYINKKDFQNWQGEYYIKNAVPTG